jgi:hypothetical protein
MIGRVCEYIRDVKDSLAPRHSVQDETWFRADGYADRNPSHPSVYRHRLEAFSVPSHQVPGDRAAEAVRLFQYRVEHRREVAGRGVDDLQHLGGRGLLLQRLARLGQQPRVFHSDHRLRGEAL